MQKATIGEGTGYDKAGGYKAQKYDDRVPRCLAIIKNLAPARMLDVGCGDGFFMDLARTAGAGGQRMSGLELSSASVATARRRGFECEVGSAESAFPFGDSSFDLVFAGEVIEHLVDPEVMLAEVHRVLSPGGHLLLTTPNLLAWFNRFLVVAGITPVFVEHSYRATYGPAYSIFRRIGKPVGHLRIFTWTPLKHLLEDQGFRIRRRRGSAYLPLPIIHQLDQLVARIYPRLASNFIVLADRVTPAG
jgi:SAM-dependent methyltransferase